MDLLDEIDDIANGQFHRNIKKFSENLGDDDIVETQVSSVDIQANKSGFQQIPTPKVPDFSLVNKIKNRIIGVEPTSNADDVSKHAKSTSDSSPQESTSIIPTNFTLNMSDSILNVKQTIPEVQKLPQLEIDEDDFVRQNGNDTQIIDQHTAPIHTNNDTQVLGQTQVVREGFSSNSQILNEKSNTTQPDSSTQIISEPQSQPLFLSSDDESASQVLSKEERQQKILQLAQLKKQQRLIQEKKLEEDIQQQTLTDEENDLNDVNDSVVSNANATDHTNMKELEQVEEFLNIQKRHRDIRPEFSKKAAFTKEKLLKEFDSDDDDEIMEKPAKAVSSPYTSPVQEITKGVTDSNDYEDEDDEDELNVLDLINNKPHAQTSTQSAKNPIELYAQKIKSKVDKNTNQFVLEDSDSDLEITPTANSKFSNDANELRNIPKFSKEQRLLLQQRFIKKNMNSSNKSELPCSVKMLVVGGNSDESHNKSLQAQQFFTKLKKNNIQQLQANKLTDPDHEILAEIEKDEEVMGSLLEREMERARRIRKREKLREKAKLALLGKSDENSGDDAPYSEVQESDYDSIGSGEESVYSSDENDNDNDKEKESEIKSTEKINTNEKEGTQMRRNDDTYMFDARISDSDGILSEKEDQITTCASNKIETINEPTIDIKPNVSEELFQNLEPRKGTSATQDISFEDDNTGTTQEAKLMNLPSFRKESQEDTQQDEPTQVDAPTQKDDDALDDDIVTPAAVRNGRKRVALNRLEMLQEEEEEEEEAMKQKIKMYERKIRKKELKMRKRRRDLERKGIKNVVEGEAVESEDEWQGLGGIDGELSDEANSEDEKMIDNNFNIDLKDEEIRKKFMEEYQIKDQAELEKLLDDIKNHRLTKRAAANGLDIEFSDEEDELLMEYRRQKKAEQLQKLKENKQFQSSLKNDKQRAFFDLIEDKTSVIKIDSDDEEEAHFSNSESQDELEAGAPIRKKIRLEESFVQKQLSFLLESNEDDYYQLQRTSRIQHGFELSDDDVEDLQALKSRSMASLASKRSESPTENSQSKSNSTETVNTDTDVDEEDEFMPSFKKPSIIKSFRSEKQKLQVSDSNYFSGVTVNKQYKVALGSKASISYLSKASSKKISIKTAKEQQLEKSLNISKQNRSNLFKSTGFD